MRTLTIAILASAALSRAAAAEPHGVRLTMAANPATAMAVSWNSDSATESHIIYGTVPTVLSTDLVAQQTFVQGAPLNNAFTATLTGLDASTTYHYRVGSAGNYHPPDGADPFSFTTLPSDPCAPFTFILIGDNRADFDGIGPNAVWAEILAETMAHEPDFFVNTGDMVKNGEDPAEWANFIDMSEAGWAYVPSILAIGNHDDNNDNGPGSHFAQLFEFALNSQNNWENYYSVDVGPIHFVALDSNAGGTEFTDMVSWLDSDLGASDRPWKMVTHHHAIYSRGNHYTGEEDDGRLNAALIPKYDAHDVDFVFNGHSHNYERYAPSVGVDPAWDGAATPRSFPAGNGAANGPGSDLADGATGTTYMVSGGAGALTTELGPSIECIDAGCTYCTGINFNCEDDVFDLDKDGTALYEGAHSFAVFKVDGANIEVDVWTTDAGNLASEHPMIADSFTMTSTDFGDLCSAGPADAGPSSYDAASANADANANSDDGGGSASDGGGADGDKAGGCGCSSSAGAAPWLLVLLVTLGLRRRRYGNTR